MTLVYLPVVDRSAVGNLPSLWVDDEHLCGAHEVQRLADELGFVVQDRHVDPEFFSLSQNRAALILQIGVQHHEVHALIGVCVAQCFVIGECVAHDRAAIALNHDDHGRLVAVVVQIVCVAVLVK